MCLEIQLFLNFHAQHTEMRLVVCINPVWRPIAVKYKCDKFLFQHRHITVRDTVLDFVSMVLRRAMFALDCLTSENLGRWYSVTDTEDIQQDYRERVIKVSHRWKVKVIGDVRVSHRGHVSVSHRSQNNINHAGQGHGGQIRSVIQVSPRGQGHVNISHIGQAKVNHIELGSRSVR